MSKLSISKAWEETKAILARDGKLIGTVALALVALPAAITGLVAPRGALDESTLEWARIVALLATLIAVAGQLAIIRLAIGPSTSVGEAIVHGIRRLPYYVAAAILITCGLILLALPLIVVLILTGVPLDEESLKHSATAALVGLAYFAIFLFLGIRMLMASSTASAEDIGPIAIIHRSWALTHGHWWRLFGFLAAFFIAVLVVFTAVGAAMGVIVGIALGPVEPLSASALVLALVMAFVNAVVTGTFAVMLARIYIQLSGRKAPVPSSGT